MNPNRPGADVPDPPPLQAIDTGEPRSSDSSEAAPKRAAPLGVKWLALPALIVVLAIVAIVVF
jgi:hypothetical protein